MQNAQDLHIEYVPITSLKECEYNARIWDTEDREQLKKSLSTFGVLDPLIVNSTEERMNVVVGGNFRMAMLKELGHEQVPIVRVHLSLEKERELNLRLNKNLGKFNFELLKEFDESLLEGVGFSSEELDQIFEDDPQERLTQGLLRRYFVDADGTEKYWLGPQLMRIASEYVEKQVVLKDRMVIGYLTVGEYFSGALTKIHQAIVTENLADGKDRKVLPILAPYDTVGSTRYVDFITTKPVQETVKSQINYVVADTDEWEQGVAKRLEQMPEVLAYVKNQNLGFSIPYEHQGITHQYLPDFIAKIELPDKQILNLLVEVTGKKDDKKMLKVKTARDLWVPAINNAEKFGRWEVLEVQDIHETQNLIRAVMDSKKVQ